MKVRIEITNDTTQTHSFCLVDHTRATIWHAVLGPDTTSYVETTFWPCTLEQRS